MLTNWSTIKTCLDNLDYFCEYILTETGLFSNFIAYLITYYF